MPEERASSDDAYDNYMHEMMDGADRAYMEAMEAIEGYCELCESTGHRVRSCPTRDDGPWEED